jgi:hypothetical protein
VSVPWIVRQSYLTHLSPQRDFYQVSLTSWMHFLQCNSQYHFQLKELERVSDFTCIQQGHTKLGLFSWRQNWKALVRIALCDDIRILIFRSLTVCKRSSAKSIGRRSGADGQDRGIKLWVALSTWHIEARIGKRWLLISLLELSVSAWGCGDLHYARCLSLSWSVSSSKQSFRKLMGQWEYWISKSMS